MRTKFNVMKAIILIERICIIIITLLTIMTIANIILIR